MKRLIPLVLALLISSGATANVEVSTYKDVDAIEHMSHAATRVLMALELEEIEKENGNG